MFRSWSGSEVRQEASVSLHRKVTGGKPATPRQAGRAGRRGPTPTVRIERRRATGEGPFLQAGFLAVCRPLASDLARRRQAFLAEPDDLNVHGLRGAARRLRAALWMFGPALPPPDAKWAQRELKWLVRRLSALRDLDVLLEGIVIAKRQNWGPQTRSEDLLFGLVTLARRDSVAAAVAALRSARASVLVDGLEAWLLEAAADLDGDVAVEGLVLPALRDLDAQVRADGRHITRLHARRRHVLRGDVKVLRYASEAFAQLSGREPIDAYFIALSDLSGILGDLNDDDVGAHLVERLAPGGTAPSHPSRKARLKAAWAAYEASTPTWDSMA
jgi:CHAD domain-containing protein